MRFFLPRALLFGDTASVLHYNLFSRVMAAIFNRLFGIPIIASYDDLGSPMVWELSRHALPLVYEVSGLLGVVLNRAIFAWGNPLPFLGLLGSFPMASINWQLLVSPTSGEIYNGHRKLMIFCSFWRFDSMTCKS